MCMTGVSHNGLMWNGARGEVGGYMQTFYELIELET